MLKVKDLFGRLGLDMQGPVDWNTKIDDTSSGVYAIVLRDPENVRLEELTGIDVTRWRLGEEIIYIGKATSLRKRLAQFYRHKLGKSSPHSGGQDVKKLELNLLVYWARAAEFAKAETDLIDIFISEVGALPFANKSRPRASKINLSSAFGAGV